MVKGATPEASPYPPGQEKAIVLMITLPLVVRLLMVITLLPADLPTYVSAKDSELGVALISAVS